MERWSDAVSISRDQRSEERCEIQAPYEDGVVKGMASMASMAGVAGVGAGSRVSGSEMRWLGGSLKYVGGRYTDIYPGISAGCVPVCNVLYRIRPTMVWLRVWPTVWRFPSKVFFLLLGDGKKVT